MDSVQFKNYIVSIISDPLVQALGFGGLLLALLTFCFQLWRYGPAIQRLNKLEVLSQLYHLGETQKEMTRSFGEATAASCAMRLTAAQVQADLDNLREFITDVQEQMSEYNADKITQARLEQENAELPPGTFFRRPSVVSTPPKTPEQLFENMRKQWDLFADVFKRRLVEAGIDPKMNRIGKMTYMLSDRRRANPLPVETADLITALSSQYRRHIALQRISSTEHDNFVQLVQTAIDEVKRRRSRTELYSASHSVEATQDATPN